jgi:hypothetical protein
VLAAVYFFLGLVIGLFVYAQVLLPLVYGVPCSLYLYFRKEVRLGAVLFQLAGPVVWWVMLLILGLVLALISPKLLNFLVYDPAFRGGGWAAIVLLLLNFLSGKGRADMRDDFQNNISRFRL